jgi:hypothetical protein
MEAISILNDWLEAPLYWRGVELYDTYGSSAFLKKLFKGSEDDYNRDKLIEAITKIVASLHAQQEHEIEQLPESLKNKLDKAKGMMDYRSALKERLRVYYHQNTSAKICKPVAFEILDINQKVDDIYGEEKFYKSTGYLPERVELNGGNLPDLLKRRTTLRTYLSRTKNPEKLAEFKQEMFEVEKQIEALTKK